MSVGGGVENGDEGQGVVQWGSALNFFGAPPHSKKDSWLPAKIPRISTR